MAVSVASLGTIYTNNGTGLTQSITPGAVSRLIVLIACDLSGDPEPVTVEYNGVALTSVIKRSTNARFEGIYISADSPNAGPANLVISLSGGINGNVTARPFGVNGVHPSSPTDDTLDDGLLNQDSPFTSGNIDTVTNDMVFSLFLGLSDFTLSAAGGQANFAESRVNPSTTTPHHGSSTKASNGSITTGYTWSGGSQFGFHLSANIKAATGNTISIDSPEALTFYQQAAGEADIPIEGTYSGDDPASVEARFNGGSWEEIDASPSGGTFSGTLTGQAAGIGTLEVRYSDETGTTDSVSNVGIGEVVGGVGAARRIINTFVG